MGVPKHSKICADARYMSLKLNNRVVKDSIADYGERDSEERIDYRSLEVESTWQSIKELVCRSHDCQPLYVLIASIFYRYRNIAKSVRSS